MKKHINGGIRKISLIAVLLTAAFFSQAQTTDTNPAWTVSKDVQKVANRSAFEKERLGSTSIRARSLNQAWVISKGVNRATAPASGEGNVVSRGIPAWTISKGVQRLAK